MKKILLIIVLSFFLLSVSYGQNYNPIVSFAGKSGGSIIKKVY